MCGIAGIIGEWSLDPTLLTRMAGTIAHRGPDDQGVWTDPETGVGLANRRLAIIDLSSAGHQPMHSADGGLVLTFNGEIYNHAELRASLDGAGRAPPGGWRGHSDTETLLQAIVSWGLKQALRQSVGMFALAVWDRSSRRLTLARDRFGEKPLYYGWVGRDFVFASELKAFRTHTAFDGSVDRNALRLYAERNYIPAPLSIYRRIFKLEPACILEIPLEHASRPLDQPPLEDGPATGVVMSRFWSYGEVLREGLVRPIATEAEAIEQLEQVLARAVQSQSITDVPVGAFLSGGIDSSTIVSLYQKYSSQQVQTFTIGFHEAEFNEASYARAVADRLGTRHQEWIVTPAEARDVIPALSQIYDEPFADSSQIPTCLVSRFARERVKVALSGDGGDELFGGYNRYFGTARVWSKLKLLPRPLRAAMSNMLSSVDPAIWDRLGTMVGRQRVGPYFGVKVRKSLSTIGAAGSLDEIFTSYLNEWSGEETPVRGADGAGGLCAFPLDIGRDAPDALRMMYCDALSYLPDDILCKVDRASMAVGLEVHAPFLDHRVAEIAARIPMGMKISGGTGKKILRSLVGGDLPAEVFDRPKTGFGIPVGQWIKDPLRGWAEDLLEPRRIEEDGWFDSKAVQRRWLDHVEGRRDSTAALWGVLMFQAWLEDQRNAV